MGNIRYGFAIFKIYYKIRLYTRYGNRETQRELGLNFLSSRYETQKRFFK